MLQETKTEDTRPPDLLWQSSLLVSNTFSEVVAQHSVISFNYPSFRTPTSNSSKGRELVFYLYGEHDPSYNWPHDLEHSLIECDDESLIPRTCSFTLSTNEFKSFTAEVVANYDFYDDWTNQPDPDHWRDHIGKFGDG